jgi:SAM-dependent methyltransferase
MNETDIQQFWNQHPCGDFQVGGLAKEHRGDYESFFESYDRYRYRKEGHILERLDSIDWKGQRVLEIGLGQGADSEQLIKRGAIWSGLDLTLESVDRTKTRMKVRSLPYERIKQGSVLGMPFESGSFDIVFSHGVLHHVPDIRRAQEEIHRVLKPGGRLVVMVYAKYSLNYLVAISVFRRLALLGMYLTNRKGSGIVAQHLDNARAMGIGRYLRMKNFIHKNTDGPFNPYAKVYDVRELEKDFPSFEIESTHKCFMHAPPLPVRRLPLSGLLGWHLWASMRAK